MKIILKHILRNIKEKKGRSLLIIFSLLITTCVFILNLTIPNQIVEASKNKTRNLIGKSDVIITSYDLFNIKDLTLNNEEINSIGVNFLDTIYNDKTLSIYGTNISKANELNLVESAISLSENEIIINKITAEKFNLNLNDTIEIKLENENFNLKIAKILDNKGLLSFKTYSGIVNEETFNKISHLDTNKFMTYYADILNDEKVEDFVKYVEDNNKDYTITKLVDEDEIRESNSYVSTILLIIFFMAIIMIYFVISTLNKMVILERLPVIGTFRSIGASKTKMNLILILENAVYGLLGGLSGSIMAFAINDLCVKTLTSGESIDTNISINSIIYGIAFSVILEIIMSIGAIIKSNKFSIKEIMFDGINSKYKLGKIPSLIGIILTLISKVLCKIAKKTGNGSLIIASKNLGHNKLIISSTRLIIAAISVMLVILNASNTFDKMLNSFNYQFSGYSFFIKNTSSNKETYENLKNIDGIEIVDNVYMLSNEEATYNDGKKFDTPPIVLGMSKSRPDIEEYNYKISDLKENEMLIDSIFADSNHINVGDTLKVKYEKDGKEYEYKVVGTVNSFYYSIQREIIVINETHFIRDLTNVPFQVAVSAKDNYNLDEIIDKVEKQLKDPDIVIQTVDEFVEDQRANIHTIMSLFYIIIGLASALVFVGIINNQIISFIERTKELAVLNSICMSKGQLIKMLIVENITSNISGCLIGFFVSIGAVKLLGVLLNYIKMFMDVKFDLNLALIFIGIVLLVLLSTVIIPIRKLRKIDIVKEIKYE